MSSIAPAPQPSASQSNDLQLGQDVDLREQDRLLPIANVGRIMKLAVPPAAKIAKEAKEAVQECVSEFICFVSSEYAHLPRLMVVRRAAERCQQEKRKTITGDDIVWAMEQLGFEQYASLMKIYLQKYKEMTKMGDKGTFMFPLEAAGEAALEEGEDGGVSVTAGGNEAVGTDRTTVKHGHDMMRREGRDNGN